jgi:enamine deaminase RidA (YjgF/YER057c/UK114 family)
MSSGKRIRVVGEAAGRKVVSTGARWEPVVGYSRAVRSGNWIAVTGTLGLTPDGTCPPDAAAQMRLALEIVIASIEALGGKRSDILRTRMYVTDIGKWEEIGRVHADMLGDIRPATTMVEVSALADPKAVVEVEADAVCGA